jgi:hypothetical protein
MKALHAIYIYIYAYCTVQLRKALDKMTLKARSFTCVCYKFQSEAVFVGYINRISGGGGVVGLFAVSWSLL